MLQYLTDDLLSGYGLPKKRMSVNGVTFSWVLEGTEVYLNDVHIAWSGPSDKVAIGANNQGIVFTLQSDGTAWKICGTSSPIVWTDLHFYLV